MTEIDVPDWVVEVAGSVLADHALDGDGPAHEALRAAITAALGAWVGTELDAYKRLRDGIGGCTDGGCVIKRPTGMHTNGGCKCWQDKIKAQRMMRAGQALFDTLRQEKPE